MVETSSSPTGPSIGAGVIGIRETHDRIATLIMATIIEMNIAAPAVFGVALGKRKGRGLIGQEALTLERDHGLAGTSARTDGHAVVFSDAGGPAGSAFASAHQPHSRHQPDAEQKEPFTGHGRSPLRLVYAIVKSVQAGQSTHPLGSGRNVPGASSPRDRYPTWYPSRPEPCREIRNGVRFTHHPRASGTRPGIEPLAVCPHPARDQGLRSGKRWRVSCTPRPGQGLL
jgi:hypothetical protein